MSDFDPIAKPDIAITSRGEENKITTEDPSDISVTLMRIDTIILEHMKNVVRPTIIDSNEKTLPVPIIYASPERWKAIRKDGYMRDQKNDRAQTPLITLTRLAIARSEMTNPSNKYLQISAKAGWNSRTTYDRFAVLNNIVPSEARHAVMVPDYIDIIYEVVVWTEYQEQMNQIIEQINIENDEFWGPRNEFKFRVRIEEYSSETELPPAKERIVRNAFQLQVAAYLIPERMAREFKTVSTNQKRYTVKKIVTILEEDQTGTKNPGGVVEPSEIKEYLYRRSAIVEK